MKAALLLILTFCCLVILVESKRCKQYTNEEAEEEFEKNYNKTQKHVAKINENQKKQGKEPKVKTKNQRKGLFKKEKDRVNEANKGNPQFCQVLNEFSALTKEELEAGFMGLIFPPKQPGKQREPDEDRRQLRPDDDYREEDKDGRFFRFRRQVPEAVDHRQSTGNGGCGISWSFTAIHVLTGVLNLKAGVKPMQYSKQQMADCLEGRNDSCMGWWPPRVWEYLYSNRMQLERDYPYLGTDNTCSYSTPVAAQTRVVSWDYAGDTESRMMTRLAEHPIAIIMNVSVGGFGSYGPFEDGTYGVWTTDESCESMNHAMTAVGYGTDPDYGDYWIIKNSWGTGFGDQGYIKVKRGSNVCNVETGATYPIISASCLAQRWQLTAKTGDIEWAGTAQSRIYIVLHGAEGDSDQIYPDDDADNFNQPGQVDVITFTSVRVGRLVSIDVGTTTINGWYMEWIELKDLSNGDVFKFVLNNWLDVGDVSEYSLNAVGAMQDWQLVTKTGEGSSAGTYDEVIGYTIQGTEGTATTAYPNNYEANYAIGKTDTFTFKTQNVGTVTGMTVTTNSWNGWYMEWATLTEVATGKIYNFVLNDWVEVDSGGEASTHDLTPVESFQKWTLETQTGTDPDAGTSNEMIYIRITGSLKSTANIHFDNAEDNLEAGQLDIFSLTTEPLGTVTQIHLGTISHNGWMPDWVKLIDNDSGTEYMFTVGEWIDLPKRGKERYTEISLTPD